MDLIGNIINRLPKVNSDINYWLVRTNSGDYYDEFVHENYVGIGWNKVKLDDLKKNQPEEFKKAIDSIQDENEKG